MSETLVTILKLAIGGGLFTVLGVAVKAWYDRRKTKAETEGIVITGQAEVMNTLGNVASKFGDNVTQLLNHTQVIQDRYEKVLGQYTEQLAEDAKLKAEVEHLTREVERLTSENVLLKTKNELLKTEMIAIRARLDALEGKA